MALTQTYANMVLGPRNNSKQMVFGIPAGGAEAPGILCLESVDAAGTTFAQVYLWADSANVLRYGTSIPTDEDSDGTIIAGTAAATASRTLDNLLVTAVNASILPGTTDTIGLGDADQYWKGVYANVLYLYSDAYITGASGKMTVTGNIVLGANGTGADLTLYGDTADVYTWWDANANTNGALIFTGATATPSLQFVQTNVTYTAICASDVLTIDATDHANAKITVGNDTTTNGIDLTWYTASAGNAVKIDAGTDALIMDDTTLIFQTTSTHSMHMVAAANALLVDGQSANDKIYFGNTVDTDAYFFGTGHSTTTDKLAHFDASAITLGLLDNFILGFGNTAAAPDITVKWNATDLLIDGAAADTVIKIGATNNQNVQIYAATATNYVLFDTDDTKSAVTFAGINAIFNDATYLAFGTGASTNGDLKMTYTGASNILGFTQVAAGTGSMTYGADGKGIDQTWYVETASSYIKLDQANDRLLAYIAKIDIGNATVTYDFALSTNSLVLSCTDNAGAKLILGTAGTNGLDVTFQAAAAGGNIAFDAGAATLTATDVTIVAVKNTSNFNGLAIPNGATASASGAATAGSIYYEIDAHKLWVCEGGTTWVYFQNAG